MSLKPHGPATPRISLQTLQPNGLVQGTAVPNSTVEVANLSGLPSTGKARADGFVKVQADAQGRFSAQLPGLVAGDVVRLRQANVNADGSGKPGNMLTVRAFQLGADARNADVAVDNLALKDLGNGKVAVQQKDTARPVSEPEAYVEIRNLRSGETALVQTDDDGNIPVGTTLPGVQGDTFGIYASDGVHNDLLTQEAGRLTLTGPRLQKDLEDPAFHPKYTGFGTSAPQKVRFTGPLFVDGAKPQDVLQGYLGDCYVCSAAGALAHSSADTLKKAIRDNGDGTYTVTFREVDARGTVRPKEVTVDSEMYSSNGSSPLYGKGTGSGKDGMELWFPIFEKAWAAFRGGGYEKIGSGGEAHEVLTAITGRPGKVNLLAQGPTAAWMSLKNAVDKGLPAVASTHGIERASLYTNSGLHANHAYSVLGYSEQDGKRMVTLRNPWGRSEPGNDGKDDGVFQLPVAEFNKYFNAVHTVR